MPFFQISLKNSELTTTHYIFRDCRAHLFRLTFLKTAVSNEEITTGPKLDHISIIGLAFFGGRLKSRNPHGVNPESKTVANIPLGSYKPEWNDYLKTNFSILGRNFRKLSLTVNLPFKILGIFGLMVSIPAAVSIASTDDS